MKLHLLACFALSSAFGAEESELALAGLAVPYDGFAGTSIAGLEASLLAMAKERATPDLLPFISEISKLVNDMMQEVFLQNNRSQQSLNDIWTAWKTCQYVPLNTSNTAQRLSSLNEKFQKCREEQCAITQANKSCWEVCTLKSQVCDAKCAAFKQTNVFPHWHNCQINPGQYLSTKPAISALRDQYWNLWQQWQKSWKECNECDRSCSTCKELETNLSVKSCKCDVLQADFESGGCGMTDSSCVAYNDCWPQRRKDYLAVNYTTSLQESAAKAEYAGLLKLRCYLNAFSASINSDQDLNASIRRCQYSDFSGFEYTSILNIRYFHEIPRQSCSTKSGASAIIPGSPDWECAYYSDFPKCDGLVKVNTCNAGCCYKPGSGKKGVRARPCVGKSGQSGPAGRTRGF